MKTVSLGFAIMANVIILCFSDRPLAGNFKTHSISYSPECLGEHFSRFKIKRADGSKFSNANFKNKIVFISFWQESSPNCVEELDAFNEMFEKLKDSSNFLFVAFSPDNDSVIHDMVVKKNIKYNFLHMGYNECVRLNHGFGFPSNFIVDKNGRIVYYIPARAIANKDVAKTTVLTEYYNQILGFL